MYTIQLNKSFIEYKREYKRMNIKRLKLLWKAIFSQI